MRNRNPKIGLQPKPPMKFSVLIANYNNGKYFKDCFDSILKQIYRDWEAIIVDDQSTDDSVNLISNLIRNDPRFKFFENDKNYGCGYTKNRCVALATGTICGFLDPDDTLLPNAIAIMIEKHILEPEVALVHSSLFYCDENLKITSSPERGCAITVNDYFTNLDGKVTAFASFKRKIYSQTDGIDITLKRAVDQDLYLKLSEKAAFYFIDLPLYKYRIHKNGISSANEFEAFYHHLKVLIKAENRRGVNFESAVKMKISSFLQSGFQLENLGNPRYLIGKLFRLFLSNPYRFFVKLFKRTGKHNRQ